jgi:hypothetical protein
MKRSEVERLIQVLENDLAQQIKSLYDTTRGEIDIEEVAEAIANQDGEAIAKALDFSGLSMSVDANESLPALLDPFFSTVAIVAASTLGFPRYTPDRTALVIRDNLRFRLANELAKTNSSVAIRSANMMYANSEPPRVAAKFIIQNIGLTANQTKSLDTFRSMLVRGQRRNTGYFPPSQLRRLNASQRSILRSVVANEVTDEDVERLTSQQRRIMGNHRAQTISRAWAYQLHHAAQQTAWESLDQQRQIDGYKRFWITARDERVRHSHRAVPGMNRHGVGLHQAFKTPLGRVQSPPLEINCRCYLALRKAS